MFRKEFRMNKQSRQKFMVIFNEMLSDKNGSVALEKVLQRPCKGDEIDTLNIQREQELSVRLGQRNILFLKKVEQAKQKILEGSYGECEDCGGGISQSRLLARPTAALCIDCQEEKEKVDFGNFSKRRDLSTKKFRDEKSDDHIIEKSQFGSVSEIAFESVVDF